MLASFWDLCMHVAVIFLLVSSYWCFVLDVCIHLGGCLGCGYPCWCYFKICVFTLVFCLDLRIHVGVILSLCIHVDVIFGFAYSCWCHFGRCFYILLFLCVYSCWWYCCTYCIPFGVMCEFVYSRRCQFGISVFFVNVHSGYVFPVGVMFSFVYSYLSQCLDLCVQFII